MIKLIIKKRYMTVQEKSIAKDIFGTSIHLEQVKIIAHRLVLKHYAISPNGQIYFNIEDWSEDFTKESLNKQSWLIHELVHVWQYQQGVNLIKKSIFDRRYRYSLKSEKSFLQYGLEQQAQIVQDYFLRLKTGQPCEDLKACIPFLK